VHTAYQKLYEEQELKKTLNLNLKILFLISTFQADNRQATTSDKRKCTVKGSILACRKRMKAIKPSMASFIAIALVYWFFLNFGSALALISLIYQVDVYNKIYFVIIVIDFDEVMHIIYNYYEYEFFNL
jgi:hypothetical protein